MCPPALPLSVTHLGYRADSPPETAMPARGTLRRTRRAVVSAHSSRRQKRTVDAGNAAAAYRLSSSRGYVGKD